MNEPKEWTFLCIWYENSWFWVYEVKRLLFRSTWPCVYPSKIAEEGIDDQLQRADQIDDGARKQIFEGNGCKADPKNDHAERGRHIGKKLNGVRHDFGKIAFDAEKVERQSDHKS